MSLGGQISEAKIGVEQEVTSSCAAEGGCGPRGFIRHTFRHRQECLCHISSEVHKFFKIESPKNGWLFYLEVKGDEGRDHCSDSKLRG
jgi:hypothetical protein